MTTYDQAAAQAARTHQGQLTKPQGSLGVLEELAIFMAGWQGRPDPRIDHAQALVFAGNHGVCARGINPFPIEVTAQMVQNFQQGGAAINQLARAAGADLSVCALALDCPTQDFTAAPAMTAAEVAQAMQTGADAVDPKADVLILGEMGIGNSTVAAALAAAVFTSLDPDSARGADLGAEWVGPGTGADGQMIARKAQVVNEGLARHRDARSTPAILAAFGGREQAAICGAIRRARDLGIVVILDGFICSAAAAVLLCDDPQALEHCLAGHLSPEPGHRRLIEKLGKQPVVTLDMRLGEGSGAAVALMVLRAALACHNGMATFADAGVSG